MRHSLSISLPEQLFKELDAERKKEEVGWSELARKAFRSYLVESGFDRLRQKTILQAAQQGVDATKMSDEEIIKFVSS